jgi:hypothetical protein
MSGAKKFKNRTSTVEEMNTASPISGVGVYAPAENL